MSLLPSPAVLAPVGTNALLEHAAPAARAALLAAGTIRQVRRGQALFPRQTRWDAAYFPYDAIVSLLAVLRDGTEVEVDSMGSEGVLGLHVAFDAPPLRGHAICQLSGRALYVPGPALREVVAGSRPLRRLLVRYALARLSVLGQSAACAAAHGAVQRTARWLLCARDRSGRDELDLTQEFLATILGVRRATITVAVGELQDAGAVRVARGVIAVHDAAALERAACECYAAVREEYAAVFAADAS